jgi:hypothetical protein
MRWKYGDTNPVVAAVDSSTVIEIGDLVYLDGDDAKPAASQANQGTEALNRERFVDNFLGVAMQRSRSGDATPIRVATSGVFEYECPSAAFELGNLVAPQSNVGGTGLVNQQVVKVVGSQYAVGRVAKREASASAAVLVSVVSTVMAGGVEGTSPSGV